MLVAALAASLAGCSSGGPQLPPQQQQAAAQPDKEYVIGSGDMLSIFVYNSPELSDASVPVRPDGRISTPLIQDIMAAGRTPKQLAQDIEQRLKKFVHEPNVTVMVRSFVGPLDSQIKVIGQAMDPEAIPFRQGLTLLDVMIATKGLTKYAAGNRAVVVRRGTDGAEKIIHVKLSDLINEGDISQNIKMQPGDTIIIPQAWF
jgi:polysaccharide export outer membrane protein